MFRLSIVPKDVLKLGQFFIFPFLSIDYFLYKQELKFIDSKTLF